MKIIKFFKTIKENTEKIKSIENKISNLLKTIENINVYNAIEMPYSENYDKRIELLIEARNRGYFNDKNYFVPIDGGWTKTAYFKHHYSEIAYNYGYDKNDDSLRIPSIGVKNNMSVGRVCIYKNGKWAKIMNDNK